MRRLCAFVALRITGACDTVADAPSYFVLQSDARGPRPTRQSGDKFRLMAVARGGTKDVDVMVPDDGPNAWRGELRPPSSSAFDG